MTQQTNKPNQELIEAWREMGPVAWAGSEYGWITDENTPINLDTWQRAILTAWFENKDTCSHLAISNVKKTGKTLVNAVLTAWRWLTLPGVHFAVGNDLDQAASRSFSEVAEMVKRNKYLAANTKIENKRLTFIPTGSTLTALAVDAAGNAGANHLTASHTEAWGIIYEAGVRSFEELTPPPGKKYGFPALRVCDSYAGFEGESKTWHELVDRGLQGKKIDNTWPIYQDGGLLLFHASGQWARDHCFRGTPAEAEAYYHDQQQTLRTNAFIRMHGNERTAGEAAFVPPEAWEACYNPGLQGLQPNDKRRLVFGADASTSHDLTALVGSIYNQKTGLTEVVYSRVWKPQKIAGIRFGKPTIDLEETIGEEVIRLYKAGCLAAVVIDPFQLHTLELKWQKAGIRVLELAQNAGRVESDQALFTAIMGRSIVHNGDPTLTEHVNAAVAVETPRGYRLAKEKASRKIDAAVALSMSHWGALDSKNQNQRTEVMPNMLYDGLDGPLSDYLKVPQGGALVWVYTPGANQKPHPPGITHKNCPRAGKCQACIEELDQEGYYEKEDEFWREQREFNKYVDPEQTERDRIRNNSYQDYSPPNPSPRIKELFWQNVQKQINQRQ
ncbi:MAG: hypothetical protein CVU42_12590 [Chloroflexi bacterium HGW-Chloroflexi-4]|jgi:phage terminase large subunit-like protein|nr:MAG: hypothetical protein CVU42_12590 [Chloroflexi bacterium HGW-Chloroflexi-4]